MASVERVTVTLPKEMAAAVRAAVVEGRYASPSEVVRDALSSWAESRKDTGADLAALREAIRKGDESGPSVPAEEVYAELREIISAQRREKA